MDVHDKWGEEMSDLIEREDAIEVAYQLRRKPNDEEWNWWLRSFNAIPSADRPQGWIPCSERLPSESGYYLCCNNGYLPYVGHFINGRWSDFDCTIVHADAWMPLPKPYGEREGE